MEIIPKDTLNTPLLNNLDDDLNDSDYIIDNIKCVKYKTNNSYRVKVIADNEKIIPKEHTFNKNKRSWITGDYLVVVMLDTIQNMRKDNLSLRNELECLKKEFNKLKK